MAHVLGGCTLALGSLDVVVTVLGPALWYGHTNKHIDIDDMKTGLGSYFAR